MTAPAPELVEELAHKVLVLCEGQIVAFDDQQRGPKFRSDFAPRATGRDEGLVA